MASSKTPPLNKKDLVSDLYRAPRIAVAFSGGLDSTALLHAAVTAHGAENVIAFHVNHGLQKIADRWVLHCARVAQELGVQFDFRLLDLGEGISSNIEARAREVRYAALKEMCQVHGINNLLIGHHQDDQAETVILQLLRGSGLGGLSAMPTLRESDTGDLRIWRPFLELTRSEIEAYAAENLLEWIEDPSNTDERFTRNAVRRRVIPLLEKIQPQVRQNLSRTAAHLAQAKHLLDQLADIDLNGMSKASGIDIQSLMALRCEDAARASNALRRWLQLEGLIMPSEARLGAWWRDLDSSATKPQVKLEWEHDGLKLRLWRGILSITQERFGAGRWQFTRIDENSQLLGLPIETYLEALNQGRISERIRSGGEKMKIQVGRPRRSLKNLFQEFDIPPWQRDAPILYIDEVVLAVAGVGMNAELLTDLGVRVIAEWHQVEVNK